MASVKRIMLVDDKTMSNFIMKKYIEIKAPEHQVYDYTDPEQAYNQLDEVSPDIIFLDLNMPVLDGWEFLKQMEQEKKDYKVAILTSSTSELDLQESTKYGNVVNFFIKPFDADELARILGSL